MITLAIHDDAKADLRDLKRNRHPGIAAKIVALLEELKSDEALQDRLLEHGFGDDRDERINVSRWLNHYNQGRNLWRLKLWELEDVGIRVRVVYAYIPSIRTLFVLGVVNRTQFDYDDHTNPLGRRILAAYDQLSGWAT